MRRTSPYSRPTNPSELCIGYPATRRLLRPLDFLRNVPRFDWDLQFCGGPQSPLTMVLATLKKRRDDMAANIAYRETGAHCDVAILRLRPFAPGHLWLNASCPDRRPNASRSMPIAPYTHHAYKLRDSRKRPGRSGGIDEILRVWDLLLISLQRQ